MKKKKQSPQKDYNVPRRLPAFRSFLPIWPSFTCTLFGGSMKQLFALDTVPIINPLESLPTGISEKLTQLKKSKTNSKNRNSYH